MKITFTCPKCGHQEELRVLAVGWKKLIRQCPTCGARAVHRLEQPTSAGLIFIGGMACWGIAFTIQAAFNLSVDATLLIFLGTCFAMTYFLGGKAVNASSTWEPIGEEPGEPQATRR